MNSFYHLARKLRRQWLPTISNSGIHNLSTRNDLPSRDLAALSLGLGFIPVPTPPATGSTALQQYLVQQWDDFDRRVHVKYFFFQRNGYRHDTTSRPVWRAGQSLWMPDEEKYDFPYQVHDYLQSVNRRLCLAATSATLGKGSFLRMYMNPPWLMASLKSLRNNSNIIVTEADKNMGIVIMDTSKYIEEGLRQLNDSSTYKTTDMTLPRMEALFRQQKTILERHGQLYQNPEFSKEKQMTSHAKYILHLHSAFESAVKSSTSEEEKQTVLRKFAAKFYLLMKMHKPRVVGRPIVSTVNSVTYFASKYLDRVLQPLLPLIPSYIQSSQHLIYQLEASSNAMQFPEDCVILCADIESLYPNIPTSVGLSSVKEVVLELGEQFPDLRDTLFVSFLMDLLKFVLTNNFFLFGSTWFYQIKGTAMGTPVAVPFACLFVYAVEKTALNSLPSHRQPLFFRRYIDDYFCVFRCEDDAKMFLESFQNHGHGLTFGSWTISNSDGIFLDLEIFKGPRFISDCRFDFRVYQKAQNRYLYLAPNSFHRRSCLIGTIKSELDRYRLNSSSDDDFYNMKRLFYHRLVARGYNPALLDLIFDSHSTTRDQLLERLRTRYSNQSPSQKKPVSMPLVFKTQFNVQTCQLHISSCLRLPETITSNDKLNTFFSGRQPINATSNAFAIQRYIGSARKHLHKVN